MTRKLFFSILLALIMLALAACGGSGESSSDGAAEAGKELFSQQIIGAQPGCITCHSLEPDTVIVGPAMAGVANRAPNRISGVSAEDYLRQSILEPDAYVVEGFQPGVMVQVWAEELSDEQVNNLIAFLLTLK